MGLTDALVNALGIPVLAVVGFYLAVLFQQSGVVVRYLLPFFRQAGIGADTRAAVLRRPRGARSRISRGAPRPRPDRAPPTHPPPPHIHTATSSVPVAVIFALFGLVFLTASIANTVGAYGGYHNNRVRACAPTRFARDPLRPPPPPASA